MVGIVTKLFTGWPRNRGSVTCYLS